MAVLRGGTRVGRTFRPDFLMVRQNLRDAGEDHKKVLLALKYGGVPSINNLDSIYNFQDKPWVFGHLLQLQRRLGKDNFPLIEQTFYPDHHEMVSKFKQILLKLYALQACLICHIITLKCNILDFQVYIRCTICIKWI
ncbi:unnamed protein product [Callosobruchus maculatus]|uniref:Synapsin pre-ATP-grasp domain-containing protein n=1 Tax=Callosobruchus maculatus TaxID=64391 RepID=A0A653CAW6_CALMS|nr:unnamed protein product [Callosobruchus maculatus]